MSRYGLSRTRRISDLCIGTPANVSFQGLAFTESPFHLMLWQERLPSVTCDA